MYTDYAYPIVAHGIAPLMHLSMNLLCFHSFFLTIYKSYAPFDDALSM